MASSEHDNERVTPSQSPPIGPSNRGAAPRPQAPSAAPARRSPPSAGNDDADQEQSPIDGAIITKMIESSPPWLFSMAFHMLMLIVMGLIVYVNIPSKPIELTAQTDLSDKEGEQLEFDTPLGKPDVEHTAEHALLTPNDKPIVDDPLATPPNMDISPEGFLSSSALDSPQPGMALTGRMEGSAAKTGEIARYGTRGTQAAVKKGLAWLARNQQRDGSWSLSGPYTNGVSRMMDNEASATAMALLALLGDGNTHKYGDYKKNVAAGWRWLSKQQDADGCFFNSGVFNHRFYSHGQCTIAVCELFGMTKDEKLKKPAQAAIDYCLRCQSPQGGWRYVPNVDSDVSVTGWIVMALQSARMAGLEVPEESLYKVNAYLDDIAQHNGSRYPYQKRGDVRLSMTAEALLMRQYLGWKRDDPRMIAGVKWITRPENLVNFERDRNVYFWYYATQVAHNVEGPDWKRWNNVMRKVLPEQQVPRGKEGGSWDPNNPTPDQWASNGGRLYVTCLSICMLEVYYRYMPLYKSVPR